MILEYTHFCSFLSLGFPIYFKSRQRSAQNLRQHQNKDSTVNLLQHLIVYSDIYSVHLTRVLMTNDIISQMDSAT